jgi:hypothetical protein
MGDISKGVADTLWPAKKIYKKKKKNLPPVSLTPGGDGKFATGINNTSETGGKICRRCR